MTFCTCEFFDRFCYFYFYFYFLCVLCCIHIFYFRNFNKTNRFKVVISRLFARHLEPQRYAKTVEVFKRWDKDGNGELSLQEFREGMKATTKLKESEIDQIFAHLDQDDNRTITIDELIVSSAFDALVAVDQRMFDAFSLLDGGDGELELSELKKVLNDLKIKDLGRAESILAEIDADANGKIDVCLYLLC